MRLILYITNSTQPLSDPENRVEFDHRGGCIGRTQDNACVLPDPDISRRHAVIQFQDGAYLLTDTSGNGVYLNDSDQPVGKDHTVTLREDDRLIIGDYELRVVLEPESGTEQSAVRHPTTPQSRRRQATEHDHVSIDEETDWDRDETEYPPSIAQQDGSPVDQDADNNVTKDDSSSSDGSNRGGGDTSSGEYSGVDAAQEFFKAAGLKCAGIPPEAAADLMKVFGGLYPEIVKGLMEMLQARANLKNEFRIRHTQVRTTENNPLKFSGRVEEALEHLVFNQGPGFLPPEAAFKEAFQDIKDHQTAMVVGMRAAFESLLRRLDPEQLEQRVIKGKKIGNLLPVNRKASCWDRYEEWYADISSAAEDDFQGLFGDEFARAYEEQVARSYRSRKKTGS